jgi:hypothetical protein
MLKVERATARAATRHGMGQFGDRRRKAQIAARHTLQLIFAGVNARRAAQATQAARATQVAQAAEGTLEARQTHQTMSHSTGPAHIILSAIHAAELQLPESWLPFVVSR